MKLPKSDVKHFLKNLFTKIKKIKKIDEKFLTLR